MGCTRWIPKLSREEMERRRLEAGEDLLAGMSQADVARKYGVNPSSVSKWKKILNEEGLEGLKARKAPGGKAKLSPEQQVELVEILIEGAKSQGYPNDLWTRKRVAKVIEKRYNVVYNFNYVADLLHRLGFSPQKPKRAASERNEEARKGWINEEWEEIKKNE